MGKRLDDLAARIRLLQRSLLPERTLITSEAFQTLFNETDPRILGRLQAFAPCFRAQQAAADNGLAAHASSGLVNRDVHVVASATKHNFVGNFHSDPFGSTPLSERSAGIPGTRAAFSNRVLCFGGLIAYDRTADGTFPMEPRRSSAPIVQLGRACACSALVERRAASSAAPHRASKIAHRARL